MSETTDSDLIRVGRGAAEVLENEAYRKAMDLMKARIHEQWKESPIRDREGQFVLLQLAKMADMFEGLMAGFVQGGKLAQHRIDLDSLRDENAMQRAARTIGRTFRR